MLQNLAILIPHKEPHRKRNRTFMPIYLVMAATPDTKHPINPKHEHQSPTHKASNCVPNSENNATQYRLADEAKSHRAYQASSLPVKPNGQPSPVRIHGDQFSPEMKPSPSTDWSFSYMHLTRFLAPWSPP